MRRGEFETLRIIRQHVVVFGDRLIIIFLRVGNFAEIELRVGSQVGLAVILQVILEFLPRQLVLSAGNVAQSVGIERIRGRRRPRAAGGAGRRLSAGGLRTRSAPWTTRAGRRRRSSTS